MAPVVSEGRRLVIVSHDFNALTSTPTLVLPPGRAKNQFSPLRRMCRQLGKSRLLERAIVIDHRSPFHPVPIIHRRDPPRVKCEVVTLALNIAKEPRTTGYRCRRFQKCSRSSERSLARNNIGRKMRTESYQSPLFDHGPPCVLVSV